MLDRHFIGDVALAVLIALPTAALARPEPLIHNDRAAVVPLSQTPAVAERGPVGPRDGLLG
jgi:hypothetical protein